MIQLLLTVLPILTVVATILLASVTSARARWIALWVVPLIGAAASWAALPVSGQNGNMLAVALVLLISVALLVYYPILLIVLAVRWSRRRAGSA